MARSFARLATSIWADDDFRTLTPDAQRVYMLAFSQANIALTGVVPYSARRWARMAAGTTHTDIEQAVHELALHRFVLVDEDTEELLVRSFVRHDGVLRSPNSTIGMTTAYSAIVSPKLRAEFLQELGPTLLADVPDKAFDSLAEPFLNDYRKAHPDAPARPAENPSPKGSPNPSPKGSGKGSPNPSQKGSGNPSPKGSASRAQAREAHARTRPEPQPQPQPEPPPPGATHPAPQGGAPRGDEPAGSAGEEEEMTDRIRTGRATMPADAPDRPATLDDVWTQLAHHDADTHTADGHRIRNRRSWLRTAAENRQLAHGDDADTWTAAGLTPAQILDRILSLEDAGDGERRPPDAAETQAWLDAVTAEEAQTKQVDADIDALPAGDFQDLHRQAKAAADADWNGPGEAPAPMVRAVMRTLHLAAARPPGR